MRERKEVVPLCLKTIRRFKVVRADLCRRVETHA